MQYKLGDAYTAIAATEGYLYVPSREVEVDTGSTAPAKGEGVTLLPGEKLAFSTGAHLYARAVSGSAVLNVMACKLPV